MKRLIYALPLGLLMLAACATPAPEQVEVTREVPVEVPVEQTVVVEVPAEEMDTTLVEFWTTDNQEDRVDVYEQVAARYMAENPGVEIRIVAIDEASLSQRIATAVRG